jgi:AsmA protein
MDFSTNLTMQGTSIDEMTKTMAGSVSLRGSELTLERIDLDEELARLQSSRNFNLVDVGAIFLAGPVGLAVTRGYEFASLMHGTGGASEIRTLVSDWAVERGVMRAQDVAMATVHSRIALRGSLDFVNQDFDDVIVALVDADGCIKVQQAVKGTFAKPVVEAPSVIETLARPALELLKRGQDLLSGAPCKVFYSGSVGAPA